MDYRKILAKSPLFHLTFLLVILGGLLTVDLMPKELFPDISLRRVTVMTPYPGAPASDVESLISIPLEEELEGVEGVKRIFSSSREGRSAIVLEFTRDVGTMDRAVSLVSQAADRAPLPDRAEKPIVQEVKVNIPVAMVAASLPPDDHLHIRAVKDRLKKIPNLSAVQVRGEADDIVQVNLDRDALIRYGLSPSQVASAVAAGNVTVPAGSLTIGDRRFLVRMTGAPASVSEIAALPVKIFPDGVVLPLSAVAEVRETFAEPSMLYRIDGRRMVQFDLFGEESADVFKIVRAVADQLPTLVEETGTDLQIIEDSTRLIRNRLSVLLSNAFLGLGLVVILLFLFAGPANALVAALGIPVSYFGALILLYAMGQSINTITLLGFIVVTGMLVDDAVVILENIQRHVEKGEEVVNALVNGLKEVIWPVTSSTLTTCAAFAPLLLVPGATGEVTRMIPLAVILALVWSLIEAFFILPGHLMEVSHLKRRQPLITTKILQTPYIPFLDTALAKPWLVPAVIPVIAILIILVPLKFNLLRFQLFDPGKLTHLELFVQIPAGTVLESTETVAGDIERRVSEVAGPGVDYLYTVVGSWVERLPTISTNLAQIKVVFDPAKVDREEGEAIFGRVKEALAGMPGVFIEVKRGEAHPQFGKDLELKILGDDYPPLRQIADEIEAFLTSTPGISGIDDDFKLVFPAVNIVPDLTRWAEQGLSPPDLGKNLEAALADQDVTTLTWGNRRLEIQVAQRKNQRRSLRDIEFLPIPLPAGETAPLRDLAVINQGTILDEIRHTDGRRSIIVSADLDRRIITPRQAVTKIQEQFADLDDIYPGYDLDFGGEFEAESESFGSLRYLFPMALLLIFGILAIQFNSYYQPFVILMVVPFSFIGAVTGLLLMGKSLSFMAMVGIVALSGVVVNDSIVLIDFANRRRDEKTPLKEILRESCLLRLRPIIITTVTTVVGLAPLAFGWGGEEPLLSPIAIAIVFGLAVSTVLTLLMIPSLFLLGEKLFRRRNTGFSADR